MRVVRSFLPVGQGAFYWEQFSSIYSSEQVNVIYDCGSKTGVEYVEKEIDKCFYRGEEIQAVFISHLDDDHINGIPHLLKHCKVKNIFFPLLTKEKITYLSLECEIEGKSNFLKWFIIDPEKAIKEWSFDGDIRIHKIPERESIEHQGDDFRNELKQEKNITEEIFSDCKELNDYYKEWIFKPFNFKQDEKLFELVKKLQNIFGKSIDNKRIEEIWRKGTDVDKKNIIKAYKEVGPLNSNSMTLFSGIKGHAMCECFNRCRNLRRRLCGKCGIYEICEMCLKEAGCLYTGDYDAGTKKKWNELSRAYEKYWSYIGCMQIPHHGSKKNYNPNITKLDAFMIISAGKKSQYNHPDDRVLKDLIMNGKKTHVVTEEEATIVRLLVSN